MGQEELKGGRAVACGCMWLGELSALVHAATEAEQMEESVGPSRRAHDCPGHRGQPLASCQDPNPTQLSCHGHSNSPLNTLKLKHVSALMVSALGGGAGNESVYALAVPNGGAIIVSGGVGESK